MRLRPAVAVKTKSGGIARGRPIACRPLRARYTRVLQLYNTKGESPGNGVYGVYRAVDSPRTYFTFFLISPTVQGRPDRSKISPKFFSSFRFVRLFSFRAPAVRLSSKYRQSIPGIDRRTNVWIFFVFARPSTRYFTFECFPAGRHRWRRSTVQTTNLTLGYLVNGSTKIKNRNTNMYFDYSFIDLSIFLNFFLYDAVWKSKAHGCAAIKNKGEKKYRRYNVFERFYSFIVIKRKIHNVSRFRT